LEGFDLSGLWYGENAAPTLFSGIGPVRIAAECGGELEVTLSGTGSTFRPGFASLDRDHLFWRRELTFNDGAATFIQAANVCRRDEAGVLFGHTVRCFITEEGEDCAFDTFEMTPFERIEGEADAEGLELVSEHNGDPAWPDDDSFVANVRVVDGIAYVVRTNDGLRIVDVSDPAAPSDIGHFSAPEVGVNDVKVVRGPGDTIYALLASAARGAVVVDVTDPSSPQLVTAFTPSGDPTHGIHTLFTETVGEETRAYLADGFSNYLGIFNVTDPANPVPLSNPATMIGDPEIGFHDLFVENGLVYVNATTAGLILVDTLADPANPTVVGTAPSEPGYSHSNWVTEAGGRKISVTGVEGYSALVQFVDADEGSAEFLDVIGEFRLRDRVSAHNIMAFGDRAYMAYYQDGVRVLDLSDPTNPTQAAHFNTWDPETAPGAKFEGASGIDVDLDAGLIYVTDTPRGLLVLRLLE
jgi:hypothetical protein